jgi:alpha-tubulin suppressor-like RCC1 family protein
VSAGQSSAAAIKNDGTLWTWGSNLSGQLASGNLTNYSSPIQIGNSTNWKQVTMGFKCFVALKTDGTLWCCGYNGFGQIGSGDRTNYSSPIQIGLLTNWKQVSTGLQQATTVAIKNDNTLWTWGQNTNGGLGVGNRINYSSPVQVGGLTNWKQVATTHYVTSAIKNDGTLWACGYNGYGQLGNSTTVPYSSPIQIGALTNWKQVSCGYRTIMAIPFADIT